MHVVSGEAKAGADEGQGRRRGPLAGRVVGDRRALVAAGDAAAARPADQLALADHGAVQRVVGVPEVLGGVAAGPAAGRHGVVARQHVHDVAVLIVFVGDRDRLGARRASVGDRDHPAERVVGRGLVLVGQARRHPAQAATRRVVVGRGLADRVAEAVVAVGGGRVGGRKAGRGAGGDLGGPAGVEIGVRLVLADAGGLADQLAGGVVAVGVGIAAEVLAADAAAEGVGDDGVLQARGVGRGLGPTAERGHAGGGEAGGPDEAVGGRVAGVVDGADHPPFAVVVGGRDDARPLLGVPLPGALTEAVVGVVVGQGDAGGGDRRVGVGQQSAHAVEGARLHASELVGDLGLIAEDVVAVAHLPAVGLEPLDHLRRLAIVAGAGQQQVGDQVAIGVLAGHLAPAEVVILVGGGRDAGVDDAGVVGVADRRLHHRGLVAEGVEGEAGQRPDGVGLGDHVAEGVVALRAAERAGGRAGELAVGQDVRRRLVAGIVGGDGRIQPRHVAARDDAAHGDGRDRRGEGVAGEADGARPGRRDLQRLVAVTVGDEELRRAVRGVAGDQPSGAVVGEALEEEAVQALGAHFAVGVVLALVRVAEHPGRAGEIGRRLVDHAAQRVILRDPFFADAGAARGQPREGVAQQVAVGVVGVALGEGGRVGHRGQASGRPVGERGHPVGPDRRADVAKGRAREVAQTVVVVDRLRRVGGGGRQPVGVAGGGEARQASLAVIDVGGRVAGRLLLRSDFAEPVVGVGDRGCARGRGRRAAAGD